MTGRRNPGRGRNSCLPARGVKAAVAAGASILVLGAAGCSSSQPASTTLQANNMYIDGHDVSVGYLYCTGTSGPSATPTPAAAGSDCYSVSAGQPWNGVQDCPTTSQECDMVVNAGRHGTPEVSQWFQGLANNQGSCTYECGSWPPTNLNVAITGTVLFNSNSYPLYLGQGSPAAGSENWWYLGPGWNFCTVNTTSGKTSQVGYCTPDGQYMVNVSNSSALTMQVYAVSQ